MHNFKIKIPNHKTKIICTIGPSCRSVAMIYEMIKAGMNVARLNFSHANFAQHEESIRYIHQAEKMAGQMINILADLPGAKIRIGQISQEPLILKKGQKIVFTTRNVVSTEDLIPVEYKHLHQSVAKGGIIYLSDGFIQLNVNDIQGKDVICTVLMGGPLFSRKGMNLPGAKLFIDPVTQKDFEMMDFGLRHGINTFGISFVERPEDVLKFRELARKRKKSAYLIAKIERREAIDNFDKILEVSDGIMVARGDLGVEIPIEEVPMIQKDLIRKANLKGRPVITATQMLVSMTQNIRPTRAEVNDVANAILDGTDAVMLSEETAMGKFPLEAICTIAKIAAATESQDHGGRVSTNEARRSQRNVEVKPALADVIAMNAAHAAHAIKASYIVTSTNSGNTVRRICRFKPPCWILSFSVHRDICQFLMLSYGVYPFFVKSKNQTEPKAILQKIMSLKLVKKTDTVVMMERRFSKQAGETDSLGIVGLQ